MESDDNEGDSGHTTKRSEDENNRLGGSVLGGAILGASLGGPIAAIIGGIAGAVLAEQVNGSKKNKGGDSDG